MDYVGAQIGPVLSLWGTWGTEGTGVNQSAHCPACGQDYSVSDHQIGVRVKCRKCGRAFTVEIASTAIGGGGCLSVSATSTASHSPRQHDISSGNRLTASSSNEGSRIPRHIGSLCVKRELGAGGMGVVYLAYDATLQRDVAIKVLTCSYYYLLTGRAPFQDAASGTLGYLHCHEPLPDPRSFVAELPDAVCRILSQGAAKDRAQRFQSAQQFAAALTAILETPRQSLLFNSPWQALAPPGAEASAKPPTASRPANVNVVIHVGDARQMTGDPAEAQTAVKSRQVAGVLAIALGCLGVHRFYLNYIGLGLMQLLITLGSCGYGAAITIPWGIVEGILILRGGMDRDGLGRGLLD